MWSSVPVRVRLVAAAWRKPRSSDILTGRALKARPPCPEKSVLNAPFYLPVVVAAAVALSSCGPSDPDWEPVPCERVVLDVVAAFVQQKGITILEEDQTRPLEAWPPAALDPVESVGALASDADSQVIHARANSAFSVTTPRLLTGARLLARTFVYPVDRQDPQRADPSPVTFRILVEGKEVASLGSEYVRDRSREHPFDQLMRNLEVDLSPWAGRAVELTFRTTRQDPGFTEGDPQAEPAWWSLSVVQPEPVRRAAATAKTPNLLVLCVDTLAAGRLSAFGYDRETSPNLAALAERGTLFAAAHAASSWTLPSTASLLTGLAPNTHGVLGDTRSYLMGSLTTWPEQLRGLGLEGAAFVSNALVAEANNFHQGFSHWRQDNGPLGDADTDAESLNTHLLQWLDVQPDGARWFAYVHYMDPHAPYGAPGSDRERFTDDFTEERDFGGHLPRRVQLGKEAPLTEAEQAHVVNLYDGEVAYFDGQLGLLLAELKERGLSDDTIVVVTADHGEELFETGRLGHGYALSEPMLHVPLVFAGPLIPQGEVVTEPVSTSALFNTLSFLGGGRSAVLSDCSPSLFPLRDLRRAVRPTFA
ncbi:MAG: hypothetical protein ACI9EF_002852, partial [Pseudohongiellaceae bacterium]